MKDDRFGELLVNEGLISRAQLEEALQIQKRLKAYKPVGQVLVERKVITKRQLNFLLDKYNKRPYLGEILMRQGLITEEQLKIALSEHKKRGLRLGETLLKLKLVTEEAMREALCLQLNIPYINLEKISIDRNLAKLVNKNYAKKHSIVPIAKIGSSITLAMNDPTEVSVINELQSFAGSTINVVTSSFASIKKAYTRIYEEEPDMGPGAIDRVDLITEKPAEAEIKFRYTDELHETKRANAIVRDLVKTAMDNNASDIHLETLDRRMTARFRIDGVLQDINLSHLVDSINSHQESIVTRIKALGKLNTAEKQRPQSGSFQARVAKDGKALSFDLRISIIPGYYGENVVLQILDQRNAPSSIGQLNFSDTITNNLRQLLLTPTGIILVTGPTGSGKSTTLFGALMHLYRPGIKILTAEDPIKYINEALVQCEVNENIGNTFTSYLRSFMKHDPEVIMIGEIRDRETADMAFRAAQTGLLLLSTLNANDAVSSVVRLMELGVDKNLIASCLAGVLSQRLVREVCTKCKKEYKPSPELLKEFLGTPPENLKWYKGEGCDYCNFTGYKGRLALGELWTPTDTDIILINKGAPFEEIRRSSYQSTIFMAQDAMDRLQEGRTNLEELIRMLPYSSIYHYRQSVSKKLGD